MNTLLLDIETAPALAYIWDLRTRYVPLEQVAEDGYILCFSASWLHDPDTIKSWSRWDDGEKNMIRAAHDLLDQADAVVSYNGMNYDIPRLNADFLRRGLGPTRPAHQIDLYRTVKGNFRVLSRSMRHMLSILGLEGKLQHKGIELWTGCMNGNREDQKVMGEYNRRDVGALRELYDELLPWISNHPNVALFMEPGDKPKCTHCGSTKLRFKGYKRTQVQTYKQFKCGDCGSYSRARFAEKSKREDVLR